MDRDMKVPEALAAHVEALIDEHDAAKRRSSRIERAIRTGIRRAGRESTCPTCGLRIRVGMRVFFMDLWHPWRRNDRMDGVAFCLVCAADQGCAHER
jgi:hypothetical protein